MTKFNADGTNVIYSTFLGGKGFDLGTGISADSAGNVYVTGYTTSSDFPTKNPIQPNLHSFQDAFVTKINAAGSALVYSTYLGGSADDTGSGIAVDSAGNAYVAGDTLSSDFPTMNAIQPAYGGGRDAFVTKINAAGNTFDYSTYLGGSTADYGLGIAVDKTGNTYITGFTYSTDFPTFNAVQPNLRGWQNAFVSKINALGDAFVYSTYLGGSNTDRGFAIAADSSGNAYVTGFSQSTDFPTANAIQPTFGGGLSDAFVTKFNAAGSTLAYSTYLGGSAVDGGLGIALDGAGNVYIAGYTHSADFLTVNGLRKSCGSDGFVTNINAAGDAVLYSTCLGGTGYDAAAGIAVDAAGSAYVSGLTESKTFPATPLAFQPSLPQPGGWSDFVAKIAQQTFVGLSKPKLGFGLVPVGTSKTKKITLTNNGAGALTINQIFIGGFNSGDFSQTNNCAVSIAPGANCTISVTFTPTVIGARKAALGISDSDPASPQAIKLSGTGE